jgi:hypothetical protein
LSNHGTPYCETYHGALGPVEDSARITSRPDTNHHRLRADRSTLELVASAVSAASAAPIEASAPKWWVHLVGVSAMSTSDTPAVAISRRLGPRPAPGMPPRRNSTTRQVPRHSSNRATGKRRASAPSGVGLNSHW